MWLVAGLGNPGTQYEQTRHNIGFMAIDGLAGRDARFSSKFQGEIAKITLGGKDVLLLKPQTYMNLSGQSVQAAMTFYKIPPANLIVLHDEVDLPLGKLRIKQGGGTGGHNGLKDIDSRIGPNYWRIRIGVGRPGSDDPRSTADYVLARFTGEEQPLLEKTLKTLTENFTEFWTHSPEKLATKLAQTLNPPPAKKPASPAPNTPQE